MQAGILFERMFVEALRDKECSVTTCEIWDYNEKVDCIITKYRGWRLKYPVEVQVTLRTSDAKKLRKYRESRGERKAASLYVEVSTHDLNLAVEPAAAAVVDVLQQIIELKTKAYSSIHAIRVNADSSYERLD
jgi:hypothetical protein